MKKKPFQKSAPKITERSIYDYIPDDHNANAGTERGLQMIESSLQRNGVGRSIVADKNGKVPAGNKTLEAAVNAGITKVIEIEDDGDSIIVHKRRDWDLDEVNGPARQYAHEDNRISQVSYNPDADVIATDLAAGVDLSFVYTQSEFASFIQQPNIDASSVDIQSQYLIMIECAGEFEQSELLERLIKQGVKCRALVS